MSTVRRARSRAMLFGLNYANDPEVKLNGCINDVRNISAFLMTQLRIPCEVFTDDATPDSTTAKGITHRLFELAVRSYREELDFVWLHFSCHGSYLVDRSRDERDGRDECLVPSDFKTAGMITDDDLQLLFRQFNPRTRVVAVFDCCHSGSIGDVKYRWESPRGVSMENIACAVGAKVITLSGCRDDQVSEDTYNLLKDNRAGGALTSCLLMVMQEAPAATRDVFALLRALRKKLADLRFTQVPCLCSTYNLIRDPVMVPTMT